MTPDRMTMARRVFFHVQHLLGIGHLRRAAMLSRAMIESGLEVTVASGGAPVIEAPMPGRLVQLPPARAADETFSAILTEEGRPIDDAWQAHRRDILLRAFAQCAPEVLLIELFPFGRRAFRFELLPLLEAAAAQRPRPGIACSVRDILVAKNNPARTAETVALLRRYFDAVLVHGDAALVPFSASFAGHGAIADLVSYTGYVVEPAPAAGTAGRGEVIVSAGGGSVGLPLLRAALAARPLSQAAGLTWRLITGPNLPAAAVAELNGAAGSGVVVERFRADFRGLIANCTLSVSQAGYNTVMDVLAAHARAVLVPFASGGETEQPLRARILTERGLAQTVMPNELSPPTLAAAIDRALARPPSRLDLALDGAMTTARQIADLAAVAAAGRIGLRP